ncbi:MAG: ATP-binding protein [Deltaproteobacteria bacterium]|nr:ATP-binding protein [Deltaproteobacteria bacterium]
MTALRPLIEDPAPRAARPYADLVEVHRDERLWVMALLDDLGRRLQRAPALLDHGVMVAAARDPVGLSELVARLGRPLEPDPDASGALDAWASLCAARVRLTVPPPPIAALAGRLGLSPIDVDVLRLLHVLQTSPEADRVARTLWPDVGLGTGLDLLVVALGRTMASRDQILAALDPASTLRRLRLVPAVVDGARWPRLALPDSVVGWLSGRPPAIGQPFELISGEPAAPFELLVTARVAPELEPLTEPQPIGRDAARGRFILVARPGAAVTTLVQGLAARQGAPLVRCDVGRYLRQRARSADAFEDGLRDATLLGAWCLLEAPGVWPPDAEWLVDLMATRLAGAPIPVILSCEAADLPSRQLVQGARRIALEPLAASDLVTLWLAASPQHPPPPRPQDLRAVLADFELSAEAILAAAPDAARRAADRHAKATQEGERASPQITRAELSAACQTQLDVGFGELATPVPTPFDLDQLIVPDDVRDQLLEILLMGRHRNEVMQGWGFARTVPYGAGVTVLFSGPSGTGKTMAATIVARRLERPLYRVDLSRIFDRYVGETEKNLARIFEAARSGHAIILFDEADALFSRRTEVKSSNDRYANLEVNYLLQRIEQHQGVVILTTNLDSSIDEAFRRRIRHTVRFPRPDAAARERLWLSMLPPETRVDAIDWGLVAHRYELPGGAIKNALLRAAYLAVGDRSALTLAHVERAAFAECAALGLLVKRG